MTYCICTHDPLPTHVTRCLHTRSTAAHALRFCSPPLALGQPPSNQLHIPYASHSTLSPHLLSEEGAGGALACVQGSPCPSSALTLDLRQELPWSNASNADHGEGRVHACARARVSVCIHAQAPVIPHCSPERCEDTLSEARGWRNTVVQSSGGNGDALPPGAGQGPWVGRDGGWFASLTAHPMRRHSPLRGTTSLAEGSRLLEAGWSSSSFQGPTAGPCPGRAGAHHGPGEGPGALLDPLGREMEAPGPPEACSEPWGSGPPAPSHSSTDTGPRDVFTLCSFSPAGHGPCQASPRRDHVAQCLETPCCA